MYVSGTTPLRLRAAQEEGRTAHETWLVDELPAGIRKIDLTDCHLALRLRQAA